MNQTIKMITPVHNPKIQSVRKLLAHAKERHVQQAFVLEGVRLAEEALHGEWKARQVLFTETLDQRGQAVVDGFSADGAAVEQISETVMKAISDTGAPPGLV